MSQLVIQDLHVSIGDKPVVKSVSLTIKQGEVHAVMGPNGTGKSTLAKAIAGHPDYTITQGDVLLDGRSLLAMEPDERARAGLFLAFQYPSEIPGVSIANFIRAALQSRLGENAELDATGYYKKLYEKMDLLKIDRKFTSRSVNDGFSGGEINLTQAKTEGAEIHLEVASVFSGVEITVPKDWKVKSNANVFLGGVDIHQAQGGDSNVTLIIHGDAVFGEIEVRK